ncbi:hypothetical protein DYB35_008702 [Aphanomyces astaci]|uniref:HTH CENPB-type domain-containing protein n=1 Tax=Aphanomyces astaci TaxID=112090 RepID=A0A3R6X2X7_APHAT|nr:hypothetical protein DYB34_006522 [Aphanomyces astaci]RHY95580.1 hypothetical protein DYB35_008702 [Aphanomyces astaci]RQM23577.1 hypothetical protein B5M09_004094 [Aphanomyces astaci]
MVPRPRGRYKRHELDRAVRAVLDGEKGTIVAARAMIPYKTLMKTVREAKAGTIKAPLRRGPKPRLPPTCEADLVAWIVAMQQDGYPVDRQVIVVKANQLLRRLDPSLAVTAGWYRRFRARHLELANRVAQVISHARNAVTMDGVNLLFDSMVEIIKAHDLSPDRIFNMDETAFASRKKSKSVVALKGSQNVWAKTVASNFHLSIVACASGRILTLALLKDMDKTKAERHEAAKRKNALLLKRGKRGSKLTMSPTGKKWARLAAKLGLVPLPNGETTRSVSNVEVVV